MVYVAKTTSKARGKKYSLRRLQKCVRINGKPKTLVVGYIRKGQAISTQKNSLPQDVKIEVKLTAEEAKNKPLNYSIKEIFRNELFNNGFRPIKEEPHIFRRFRAEQIEYIDLKKKVVYARNLKNPSKKLLNPKILFNQTEITSEKLKNFFDVLKPSREKKDPFAQLSFQDHLKVYGISLGKVVLSILQKKLKDFLIDQSVGKKNYSSITRLKKGIEKDRVYADRQHLKKLLYSQREKIRSYWDDIKILEADYKQGHDRKEQIREVFFEKIMSARIEEEKLVLRFRKFKNSSRVEKLARNNALESGIFDLDRTIKYKKWYLKGLRSAEHKSKVKREISFYEDLKDELITQRSSIKVKSRKKSDKIIEYLKTKDVHTIKELYSFAKKKRISKKYLELTIEDLKIKGDLFEPRKGKYKIS